MALHLGWQAWYVAIVLVLMITALIREWARPDLILLGCLGLFLAAGVAPPEVAFAGFSNSAVITIAALFIVAAGVQQTDAFAFLDRLLFTREPARMAPLLLRLMGPTALISAFANNTPLVAMLVPRLKAWALRVGIAPSKVMIPLSYAAVLGGLVTLIGTSTNLVVSGFLLEMTGRGFAFFDLTWVGLPAACVAIVYFALIGHRALPERRGAEPSITTSSNRYHFELRVGDDSPLAGKTVEEAGLRALGGAYLAHVIRSDYVVGPVGPYDVLQPGDTLVFVGDVNWIDRLLERPGLERATRGIASDGYVQLPLFEAVVSDTSSLVGKTLREVGFREQFGGVVLAIQRRGEPPFDALGRVPLKAGDLLLIEARDGFAAKHSADREDFFLVAPRRPGLPGARRAKAPVSLGLLGVMVLVSALGIIPLVTAAFAAALGMIATGCLRLPEARQAVDLPVLLMIAAALGIGGTVETTGLAEAAARVVVGASAGLGPFAVLAALYLTTNVMTELLTNSAAAALFVPIALAVAADLQISPIPLAVCVAIAASAGFTTPVGYQTHLMVMGAGGYRFADFVRAGLPLNLIVMVVTLAMIWLVWM